MHAFEQTVIAIIWDFDKTLIDGYMQDPIFSKYQINPNDFWKEVQALPSYYQNQGVRVNRETVYLNHFLSCVKQGIFARLNNSVLFELGKELKFYPGVPAIFKELKDCVEKNKDYSTFNITVEHYVISTGLAEMIKGSLIAKHVKGIWGCEFIEAPMKSALEIKEYVMGDTPEEVQIAQVGYTVDNTSKTRALFEINKGVNVVSGIDVNARIPAEARRVPFGHMIYIADGPSDVPVFSILKQNGGKSFAVYPKGDARAFKQVDRLRQDGRIDMYGEADYSQNTTTHMWLVEQTQQIANTIYHNKLRQIQRSVSKPPVHLDEEGGV